MLLPHHLDNAGLNRLHLDAMQRHGVSKQRLCSLFRNVDRLWHQIKHKSLTAAIQQLQAHESISANEALCIVQLYFVLKRQEMVLLN